MTNHNSNIDPIERLRAADPAAGATSDPSLPHVRATLEEILMTKTEFPTTADDSTQGDPIRSKPNRPAPWMLVAAATVVLAGVIGAFALAGGDDAPTDDLALTDDGAQDPLNPDGPEVNDPAAGGDSSVTSCVESYDLETLPNREYAFDGTVESVDGDNMTFTVNEWFAAGTVDGTVNTVTLDHQGLAGMLFAPEGPSLEPGTRVLVAGDGGFVWSCGFTQLYDETIAGEWRSALG